MKSQFKTWQRGEWALAVVALAVGLWGCTTDRGEQRIPRQAVVELHPTQGNQVHGTIRFSQVADGIRVVADVSGLTPGKHGFHIHEKGDCSAPDASSAGGHFNPTGMPHGGPHSVQRHVGDLGNLVADQSGRARAEFIDTQIAFEGPNSILNRSVIVHAQPDDLVSQPTGNAGARVACGIIEPKE